jgi:radical SAM superfamily enzyme YgiQ (UPF0313 family)
MAEKVLFIASEDEENLSIRYPAAALTQAGHTIEIAPFSVPADIASILRQIQKFRPDIIAISMAFQSRAPSFFELIKAIRQNGYKGHITAGGHFPTFEYKKILETQEGIDTIVRFEGEQALTDLAEYLAGKREISSVANLVYRKTDEIRKNPTIDHFPDLDTLPFPVRNSRPQVRLGENFATLVSSGDAGTRRVPTAASGRSMRGRRGSGTRCGAGKISPANSHGSTTSRVCGFSSSMTITSFRRTRKTTAQGSMDL